MFEKMEIKCGKIFGFYFPNIVQINRKRGFIVLLQGHSNSQGSAANPSI